MGKFKIKTIKSLEDCQLGDEFEESDFAALTPSGKFVQMEYMETEEKLEPYNVKPGLWKIIKTSAGMRLVETSFTKDEILDRFVNVTELTNNIDCFFRNLNEYKLFGMEVPKRAALLWGPPGTGKTSALIHVSSKYLQEHKDIAVVIWNTDSLDPFDVKTFIQTFDYKNVSKLILIAEDIGGVEMEQAKMKSTSSLLSLLDNKEKTFTVPVFIIATTNFPENFLANLTNRPGRFDDKIEMGKPTPQQRVELFNFFLRNFKDKYSQDEIDKVCKLLLKKEYEVFSIAHLQEVVVRARIYERSLEESTKALCKEIEVFNKEFQTNKGRFGIGLDYED